MTVLNKEMKENRRVELTIRVERQEWQQALDNAYQANRDLYPVDGCAPGKATRQALEQAYAPDVFYQEAVNATFPGPWWRPSAGRRSWWPGPGAAYCGHRAGGLHLRRSGRAVSGGEAGPV